MNLTGSLPEYSLLEMDILSTVKLKDIVQNDNENELSSYYKMGIILSSSLSILIIISFIFGIIVFKKRNSKNSIHYQTFYSNSTYEYSTINNPRLSSENNLLSKNNKTVNYFKFQ